jgi:hypothetical protein
MGPRERKGGLCQEAWKNGGGEKGGGKGVRGEKVSGTVFARFHVVDAKITVPDTSLFEDLSVVREHERFFEEVIVS